MENRGKRKTTERIVQSQERMTDRRREEESRKQNEKKKNKKIKRNYVKIIYCKGRNKRKYRKGLKSKSGEYGERINAILGSERK